jgi:DNA-binding response OmpR family regulator
MSEILVVDDEEEIRFLLAKFLKVRKHDAVLASSGEEGLEDASNTNLTLSFSTFACQARTVWMFSGN